MKKRPFMKKRMLVVLLVGACAALALAYAVAGEVWPLASEPSGPVLVELFTSEGCSSCPPADAVLAQLADDPQVIALGFHVDYWNYLGWRDAFSDPQFSQRQRQYAAFHGGRTYTPQMIVNGAEIFVGSDERRAHSARAGASSSGQIALTVDSPDPEIVNLLIHASGVYGPSTVCFAITEDYLTSEVTRGENAGRELKHMSVVRQFKELDTIEKGASEWKSEETVALSTNWRRENLRLVAFVQEVGPGAVVAVTETQL